MTETFAGFDRADCPGLGALYLLKLKSNLQWCGYYLHAPSQPASTWKGKRAALVAQGWGLAPIYVGQQIVGPGSHNVTAAQGAVDGVQTVNDMQAEGFPLGSTVFLDLENGPPFTSVEQSYVSAWVDTVAHNGYQPGVYCSYQFAQVVYNLRKGVRLWVFHVPSVEKHNNNLMTFPTPLIEQSGFALADIWQREDAAVLTQFGNMLVDLDVATSRDPGAPIPQLVVTAVTGTIKPGDTVTFQTPLTPAPKPDNWFVSLFKRWFNV